MKNNEHRPVTKEEPSVELDEVARGVATVAVVGGVAAMVATSDYNATNNSLSREFDYAGISNGESVSVANGQLTTASHQGVNLGFASTNETHTQSTGLFNSSSAHSKEVEVGGGFFSSSQEQHQSSGAGGMTSGQSGETTIGGLTVSGSEETSCCTGDNCCSYHYDLNCCGEGCAINISSTCCCAPCINGCQLIGGLIPSLDDCGNCISPVTNACSSMTDCLPNLSQVGECLSGTVGVIRPAIQCIGEVLDCVISLIPSD